TDTRINGLRNVFISGFAEVTANDTTALTRLKAPHDLSDPTDPIINNTQDDMVFGIPLVIGARKGLPNFNKFVAETLVQVTRKLQFHRKNNSPTESVNLTNQLYLLGITNTYGIEGWNSYAATLNRKLQLFVYPDIVVMVSNAETHKVLVNTPHRP